MSNVPRNISRPVAASPAVNSSAASSFFIGILAIAGMVASIVNGMWYLAVAVLVLWAIVANIRIVPQEHAYIIERLGKFKAVWYAGLHVKIPIIDNIVNKISLKEQVFDFPPQPVITKDNVSVKVDSVVFSKVFDPQKYTYGVENPIAGLQNLSATTLRSIIGGLNTECRVENAAVINVDTHKNKVTVTAGGKEYLLRGVSDGDIFSYSSAQINGRHFKVYIADDKAYTNYYTLKYDTSIYGTLTNVCYIGAAILLIVSGIVFGSYIEARKREKQFDSVLSETNLIKPDE